MTLDLSAEAAKAKRRKSPADLIAGVDVSSKLLAIVRLDASTGALYDTLELRIRSHNNPAEMPRDAAFALAAVTLGECGAVFIEDGMGRFPKSVALLNRVVGALLHSLVIYPETSVNLYAPSVWKKLAGLKGNADKPAIKKHAKLLYPKLVGSQDIHDAACIGYAGYQESLHFSEAA